MPIVYACKITKDQTINLLSDFSCFRATQTDRGKVRDQILDLNSQNSRLFLLLLLLLLF